MPSLFNIHLLIFIIKQNIIIAEDIFFLDKLYEHAYIEITHYQTKGDEKYEKKINPIADPHFAARY
jgi:hypothetical protein